jgi:DNA-nicking Smr family endonuclease
MSKKEKPTATGQTRPLSGRKGTLSDDDTVVWSYTASSIEPLKRKKARVLGVNEAVEAAMNGVIPPAPSKRPTKTPPAKQPHVLQPLPVRAKDPPSLTQSTKAPPLADFDRRKARQLAGGQVSIDARLDLHGFRQSEAHAALRNFLFNAYRRGHRWVLIITGKGGRPRARDDDDFSFMPIETGVLKRNVPMWLEEPELRAIVVSHRPAAIKHGGDGALYIHLRNPEKAGR